MHFPFKSLAMKITTHMDQLCSNFRAASLAYLLDLIGPIRPRCATCQSPQSPVVLPGVSWRSWSNIQGSLGSSVNKILRIFSRSWSNILALLVKHSSRGGLIGLIGFIREHVLSLRFLHRKLSLWQRNLLHIWTNCVVIFVQLPSPTFSISSDPSAPGALPISHSSGYDPQRIIT